MREIASYSHNLLRKGHSKNGRILTKLCLKWEVLGRVRPKQIDRFRPDVGLEAPYTLYIKYKVGFVIKLSQRSNQSIVGIEGPVLPSRFLFIDLDNF
jgi:hypothetical protein